MPSSSVEWFALQPFMSSKRWTELCTNKYVSYTCARYAYKRFGVTLLTSPNTKALNSWLPWETRNIKHGTWIDCGGDTISGGGGAKCLSMCVWIGRGLRRYYITLTPPPPHNSIYYVDPSNCLELRGKTITLWPRPKQLRLLVMTIKFKPLVKLINLKLLIGTKLEVCCRCYTVWIWIPKKSSLILVRHSIVNQCSRCACDR